MGNNICQCKIIYQNFKEADLSLNKSSKNLSSSKVKKKKKTSKKGINSNNCDLSFFKQKSSIKYNEKLERIYINNCVKKIIRAYLNYKKNKIRKNEVMNNGVNNNINENSNNINLYGKTNNNNSYNNIDNSRDENCIDMNHPFFIDKVHHSKTNYKKIDIPKINNGISLDILLNKNSTNSNNFTTKNKKDMIKTVNSNNSKY